MRSQSAPRTARVLRKQSTLSSTTQQQIDQKLQDYQKYFTKRHEYDQQFSFDLKSKPQSSKSQRRQNQTLTKILKCDFMEEMIKSERFCNLLYAYQREKLINTEICRYQEDVSQKLSGNRSQINKKKDQISKNTCSFLPTRRKSFYQKDTILQLLDDQEYKSARYKKQKSVKVDKKKSTQDLGNISNVESPPSKPPEIQTTFKQPERSQKKRFSELLEQYQQKNNVKKLDKSTEENVEVLFDKTDQVQHQIQVYLQKWLHNKTDMLGQIITHFENFQDLMVYLDKGQMKKATSPTSNTQKLLTYKKNLIKKVGELTKSLKVKKVKQQFDFSEKSQDEKTDQVLVNFNIDKRNIMDEFLNLEDMGRKPTNKFEMSLEKKRNEYWNFDKKGRHVNEVQQRIIRKRQKQYGIIFSQKIRIKFDKIRESLINCIRKMKIMRISAEDLMSERVILKKAYQREGSYMFFKFIENGNLEMIKLCVKKCRYYIFDIDFNLQTGLHIACTKNNYEVAKYLLSQGAYYDQTDLVGRTPLWYAVKNEHIQITRLLLYYQCNPWSFTGCTYYTENQMIFKLLKVARRLNMLLLMTPFQDREKVWNSYKNFISNFGNQDTKSEVKYSPE